METVSILFYKSSILIVHVKYCLLIISLNNFENLKFNSENELHLLLTLYFLENIFFG